MEIHLIRAINISSRLSNAGHLYMMIRICRTKVESEVNVSIRSVRLSAISTMKKEIK